MTEIIQLKNSQGLELTLMTKGAALLSLKVPVGAGKREVLAACKPEDYDRQTAYLNAIAGRFANRIANSSMSFAGQTFHVTPSQGPHCLHGGTVGFDKKEWSVKQKSEDKVILTLVSPDGDQGFPGECVVELTYALIDTELSIEMTAHVSKPCPVNLTSHAYFNLDAERSDVRNHQLSIHATRYLPIDNLGIPLATAPEPLQGSLNLQQLTHLNEKWLSHPQLVSAKGYDHCYLLDTKDASEIAASLISSDQQLRMDVYTNQPGLQLYTGNYLAGNPAVEGPAYHDYEALCLEAQLLPDSPNRPDFGDPWLLPDQNYRHITKYRFSVLS